MSPEKYLTGLRDTNVNGEYSWASVGVKRAVTFSNWNFSSQVGALALKL